MGSFRVGLISTLSPEFGQAHGSKDLADATQLLARARGALEGLGAEIIDPGEPTFERPQAARHGRLLRGKDVQVLVVYMGQWTHAHTAMAVVLAAGVPVIVWGDLRPGGANLAGVGIFRGALDEVGIPSSLVTGGFDDPTTLGALGVRCRAASALGRLRGQVCGLMGQRSLGMVAAAVDPSGWLRQFGVDIDDWDMLETVERARAIPDNEPLIQRYAKWIEGEFGRVAVSKETIVASIKLYLASKGVVQARGYDFVAVKCIPYMPEIYTTFCFAIAMLNDDSDAEGPKERVPCACEADANGALTMQIMNLLSGGPVNFADLFEIDPQTRIAAIGNCGSQSTQLARSRQDIHWVPNEMIQFRWRIHGMCPQYIGKPGRVTLARLSRVKGEYVMLITGGEALEFARTDLEKMFAPFCPRTFVKLDCDAANFQQSIRSNHVNSIYGDYGSDLVEFCRLSGVKPLVLEPVKE